MMMNMKLLVLLFWSSVVQVFPVVEARRSEIAFANAYPSEEAVCFMYGSEPYELTEKTEAVKYSESILVNAEIETEFIYLDIFGGHECSQRLGGIWYESISSEQVNALIWALNSNSPSAQGIPTSNLHWEPDVDLSVYENLAIGFDSCHFEYELLNDAEEDGTRLTRTTKLNYGISSKSLQGVDCYEYANVHSIHAVCTAYGGSNDGQEEEIIKEEAEFMLHLDDICAGITHVFLAIGKLADDDFPLSIMLVQAGHCQESCADYIRDFPPPPDYNSGENVPGAIDTDKKEDQHQYLLIIVAVLSALLGICLFLSCLFYFCYWRRGHRHGGSYVQTATIASIVEIPSLVVGDNSTALWGTASGTSSSNKV